MGKAAKLDKESQERVESLKKIPRVENRLNKRTVPPEIAVQHARQAEIAMAVHGNAEEAHRAIDRAFEVAEERRTNRVTLESPVSEVATVRMTSILSTSGIQTIGELVKYSPQKLARVGQIGEKSIELLRHKLSLHGFDLLQKKHC